MSERNVLTKNEGIERLRKFREKDQLKNHSETEEFNNEKLEKDYLRARDKKLTFLLKEEAGTDALIADAAKKTRREIEFKSEILKDA